MAYNKYGVSPKEERTYNGKVYDSRLEMQYRKHLETLMSAVKDSERVVEISEQPVYECMVNGKMICKYRADFEVLYADGRTDVIDTKGVKTAIYSLKKKLVEALWEVKIKEVYKEDF